ncbi:alpha/beta hydrolase family protein [Pseudonocardia sp. GCM10023141]|uniref:alpha/beta hydrolase family protein n=1 Tax=Pseudonocardia sp. GCM10023141 TaxID=3252653 RepID=UPI0036061E12
MGAPTCLDAGAETRISFSVRGDVAACLVADSGGRLTVEHWDLAGDEVVRRRLDGSPGESTFTQLLCLPGGQVLLTRPEPGGRHRIALVTVTPDGLTERSVGDIESAGFRLLPTPDPATLAIGIGTDASGTCVWKITAAGLGPPMSMPGQVGGGVWLDSDGTRLAVVHAVAARQGPTVIDLSAGTVEAVSSPEADGHLILASAKSGLRVLAVSTDDGLALGFAHASARPSEVRVPRILAGIEGTVLPVAVNPDGTRVCLHVTEGARSRLYVFEPAGEDLIQLPLPAGRVYGDVCWDARGLTFPFSSSDRPVGLTRLIERGSTWHVEHLGSGPVDVGHWASARLVDLPGPAGPIQAVVYGDEHWRDAENVVIALHGGPAAAWDLGFDPLLQRFVAAGLTVVAPNQRGSTGYGPSHRTAIHHAWGGPDLDDIRHLARSLCRDDRRLLLYGASYGAFLALMAAAAEPDLWSRCVAVAPFLSAASLYDGAGTSVRTMIDALGGRTPMTDAFGPRDLAVLGTRITAALLFVHGTADDVIPVIHSRILGELLDDCGKSYCYREVSGGSHYPIGDANGVELAREIAHFLASGEFPSQVDHDLERR